MNAPKNTHPRKAALTMLGRGTGILLILMVMLLGSPGHSLMSTGNRDLEGNFIMAQAHEIPEVPTGGGGADGPGGGLPLSDHTPKSEPGSKMVSDRCECVSFFPRLELTEPHTVGGQVKELQEILAFIGHDMGHIDGIFGEGTQQAVSAFQEKCGLPPTGVTDYFTWVELARAYEAAIFASAPRKAETPPPPGEVSILIDTSSCTLTVLSDGKKYKTYPAAVGKAETPTPLGEWTVIGKAAWAGGFGTRWMGLNVPWGKFGIHGTNRPWSVGRRESHGCIRMYNRDVEEVFRWVKVGTRVKIEGGPFGNLGAWRQPIKPGASGSAVYELQKRMKKLGYYDGNPDGRYGKWTETQIMKLQKDKGLPVTGIVDARTFDALGLYLFE